MIGLCDSRIGKYLVSEGAHMPLFFHLSPRVENSQIFPWQQGSSSHCVFHTHSLHLLAPVIHANIDINDAVLFTPNCACQIFISLSKTPRVQMNRKQQVVRKVIFTLELERRIARIGNSNIPMHA